MTFFPLIPHLQKSLKNAKKQLRLKQKLSLVEEQRSKSMIMFTSMLVQNIFVEGLVKQTDHHIQVSKQ